MFVLVAFHHWRVNTMTFTTKLQDRFLDIDYVEEILKRNKYIKSGQVKFEIEKSNNDFSKSIYIKFYTKIVEYDYYWKHNTLRVSDHYLKVCPHRQFIVTLGQPRTRNMFSSFERTIYNQCKMALNEEFRHKLKRYATTRREENGREENV